MKSNSLQVLMRASVLLAVSVMVVGCGVPGGTGYGDRYATAAGEGLGIKKAATHPIVSRRPAVGFFEGAVLGNGGLGAIVTTRPDAVEIYFGHNDVWDIRIAENNRDKIGTFKDVFEKIKAIPGSAKSINESAWFKKYRQMCRENYAKPYPRPFPCGRVILWFDRREAELLGHSVHIDSGLCRIDFLIDGEKASFELFADMTADRLWGRMVSSSGKPIEAPFKYITFLPDPSTPRELPKFTFAKDNSTGKLSFRQVLPFKEISAGKPYSKHPRDKAFCLTATAGSGFDKDFKLLTGVRGGVPEKMKPLQGGFAKSSDFVLCFDLKSGKESSVSLDTAKAGAASWKDYDTAADKSRKVWREYWSKSGIDVDDEILERTWYWNLYFFRCAIRRGVTCPGLFANWSHDRIGTAWHGDYHFNYNTQQPFWLAFSSNHTDLHLPYVDMVERTLLPVSKKWAKEYYNMRGAFFPHSAYPVEMTMNPYPVPGWGWEVFETPWTVQSLWWHYTYTMDREYLKSRAFGPIKEAVLFLVDYIKRPDARGKQWGDDKYHIYPSVPPELYGLKPGFDKNIDTIADLTLTKFIFNAYLRSCKILDIEGKEKDLTEDVKDILANLSDYPKAQSKRGEVFVSVKGEDPEIVYNCPASLMTVFPGEEHGLDSAKKDYQVAVNTYRNQQNEGGNELVFLNAQAARLGILDIEKFKRQIEYCLLPNGTCTLKVLQSHGRYPINKSFTFMGGMGIWFENFSLPFVINECLLQGYDGKLRFFPNWPAEKDAEFRSLRTVGAFLVSAKRSGGKVRWIEVLSEAGQPLTIISPWKSPVVCKTAAGKKILKGQRFTIKTKPGQRLLLLPAQQK
jgi:alpha-L-fucosidase 2